LRHTPVKKSTLTPTFLLACFCAAPYKHSCEAALSPLPFLGVSSLMNWPGGFAGLFFGLIDLELSLTQHKAAWRDGDG